MSSKFQIFLEFLGNKEFKTTNKRLKEVVDGYKFLEVSEQKDLEQNKEIFQNLDESKVIIISHYK